MFVKIKFIEATTKKLNIIYEDEIFLNDHSEIYKLSVPRVGDIVGDSMLFDKNNDGPIQEYKVKQVKWWYDDFRAKKKCLKLDGVYVYLKPIKTKTK